MPFDDDQVHLQPFVHATRSAKSLHFSLAETQSSMKLAQPDALELEYTRLMMGFLLWQPQPQRIAMIGLGGGSLAKFCHRHLPLAQMSVVEINPHVIALRDEFAVPPDGPRFEVVRGDGARFIKTRPAAFDVLLIDGYDYDGLPGQLATGEFYDDCFACLRPAGMVVANVHVEHSDYAAIVERVGRSAGAPALPVLGRERGNAIVFARKAMALDAPPPLTARKPQSLAESQWQSLQAAFARVRAALARPAP